MKHVVEAGTSTASSSSLSANPPSDHDGSQPSTSETPSLPESSIASSDISGTSNEISDVSGYALSPTRLGLISLPPICTEGHVRI